MNRKTLMAGVILVAGVATMSAQARAPAAQPAARPAPGPGLTLTTTAFEDGGIIPNKYTSADPKAVSPRLTWYHHYTWELFALDLKLDLTPEATRADVLKAMDGHILGKGVLVGRFHR